MNETQSFNDLCAKLAKDQMIYNTFNKTHCLTLKLNKNRDNYNKCVFHSLSYVINS